MRYKPRRRKQRVERGWTVLEISLAVFLAAILGAAFMTIHRKKQRAATVRECSEKQWYWTNAMDRLETELRQWEIGASPCLVAGFAPVRAASEGTVETVDLLSARPIVNDMRVSRFVSVPVDNTFKPGDQVILCNAFEYSWGEIKRVHTGGESTASLELRLEDESASPLYGAHSVIVAVKKALIQKSPGDQPGTYTVFRQEDDKRKRPWIRLLDQYAFDVISGQTGAPVQVDLAVGYGACQLERSFALTRLDREAEFGEWLLGEKELFFKRWIEDRSEGDEG